jgi:hypothetical protein
MRTTVILSTILTLLFLSCSDNTGKTQSDDPAKTTIPGNSDATNPSLADTAYSKLKKDSVKKNVDTLNHK